MNLSRSTPAVRTPEPNRSGARDDGLAVRLPVLRAVLEQQLRFRREQLARLAGCGVGPEPSHGAELCDGRDPEAVLALRAVDVLVAAGAVRALTDIELALRRMRAGRYGHCRSCGTRIPLAVLVAIPKTTLCLTCQARRDRARQPAPAAHENIRRPTPTGG
jgi:DnaK suppressor protein